MVDENGDAIIEPYINNIHPISQAPLYPLIANIFSKFVPILEQVLADMVHEWNFCRSGIHENVGRPKIPYSLKGKGGVCRK